MNNCIYGKTIENMRNRMKLRIVTNEKDFIKHASKPTFMSHKIVDKYFVIIHEKNNKIVLNKPIYVGCTVLEISKLAMYEFWYGLLKKKCKNINLFCEDYKKVPRKMKDERPAIDISEFFGLKPKW